MYLKASSLYGNPPKLIHAYLCRSSYHTESSQYLEESFLPTNFFQKSLPRLPVPDLKKTLSRYLASQEAIQDKRFHDITKSVVEEFGRIRGPILQNKLLDFASRNPDSSYVSGFWYEMYLRNRSPIVLTNNPVVVFKQSRLGNAYNDPIIRAANLIHSSIRFMASLRDLKLKPDILHSTPLTSNSRTFEHTMGLLPSAFAAYGARIFKAYPLEMSQYDNMFNSTRIPATDMDRLQTSPGARHIVVLSRGEIYTFEVLDDQGRHIRPSQVVANLQFIRKQPDRNPEKPNVNVITAMDRDGAALLRERLNNLDGDTKGINAKNFDAIDSAIMVVAFSEGVSDNPSEMLSDMLAGPADSRWFDKSFSLIVNRSGTAAVNFEHSWADGLTVVRYCNEIYKDSETRPSVDPDMLSYGTAAAALPAANVKRLEWYLEERLNQEVLLPQRETYEKRRANLLLVKSSPVSRRYTPLNRELCKRSAVSPDAMIQLALQVAHARVHCGRPAATYEACSTAAFRRGRTETIRPATLETRRFTELLLVLTPSVDARDFSLLDTTRNPASPHHDQLLQALHLCSQKHSTLIRAAAYGQGWDRHLFALRRLAEEDEAPATTTPSIFTDPAYANINDIILSTSTLSSPAIEAFVFAPTSPNGYGISYAIKKESCDITVTSWRSSGHTKACEFVDAFNTSAREIAAILKGTM